VKHAYLLPGKCPLVYGTNDALMKLDSSSPLALTRFVSFFVEVIEATSELRDRGTMEAARTLILGCVNGAGSLSYLSLQSMSL
jgi:hypothetical protein